MHVHVAMLPLALLLPAIALAQPRPGKTTVGEVIAAMGEPDLDFTTDALPGDVQLHLVPGYLSTVNVVFEAARNDPDRRRPAEYRVLQYWDRPDSTEKSSFVFGEGSDILLYAIVPPSSSEATLDKAKRRYGRAPEVVERMDPYVTGCLWRGGVHYVFEEEGVELVAFNREGRIDRKVYVRRDAKGRTPLYGWVPREENRTGRP